MGWIESTVRLPRIIALIFLWVDSQAFDVLAFFELKIDHTDLKQP